MWLRFLVVEPLNNNPQDFKIVILCCFISDKVDAQGEVASLCTSSLQVPTEVEHLVRSLIKYGAMDLRSKNLQTVTLMWNCHVSAVYSEGLKRRRMMTPQLLCLLNRSHTKTTTTTTLVLLHHRWGHAHSANTLTPCNEDSLYEICDVCSGYRHRSCRAAPDRQCDSTAVLLRWVTKKQFLCLSIIYTVKQNFAWIHRFSPKTSWAINKLG